jgi:hypothetical protein
MAARWNSSRAPEKPRNRIRNMCRGQPRRNEMSRLQVFEDAYVSFRRATTHSIKNVARHWSTLDH